MDVKIIHIESKEYPEILKRIENPPQKLYVKGNHKILQKRGIAIIGSRKCTQNGKKLAEEYAMQISKKGFNIISGMAIGIDTAAHIGALKVSEKTIAVLGSGFNHIYPKENQGLYKEIISKGGAVISEYEEDTFANGKNFVERNRIVSGLSEAVLIIEAKYRSGTSITAQLAKKQGKKIFCIAHGIEEKCGVGTNKLIKKGAIIVTEIEDILKKLGLKKAECKKEKIKIPVNIDSELLPIYNLINEKSPMGIQEIYRNLKYDINKINYMLTMLELEGIIHKIPGKGFVRKE